MEEKNINFLDYMSELEDPRIERNKLYGMSEILFLTLVGLISGCEGWTDVEDFGETHIDYLRKYLPYKNGIPSDDTLRRFFRALDPKSFSSSFSKWAQAVVRFANKDTDCNEAKTVAIDGKTSRRTYDHCETNDREALHRMSAFVTDLRIVIGQQKINDKSNETTAIPELLDMLDIENTIITIDAIGCQKKIAQKIVEKNSDYLFALKGNQGDLHEEVKTFFELESKRNYKDVAYETYTVYEKGHGRLEKRTCTSTSEISCITKRADWIGIKSISRIESVRIMSGTETIETRYYISSLSPSAKKILDAARSHWQIENSLHWVLDVCFNDDQSRIRKGNAPQNIAIIKSAALSLLNLAKPSVSSRISIKRLRKVAGWDPSVLDLIVKLI
jgi:predicted transposase YbfD/YdcC